MTDSVIEFLDTLAPFWDLARDIFSFRIFGVPLYGILVSLFMLSFVLTFIKGGGVSFAGSLGGVLRASRAAKSESEAKRRRDEAARLDEVSRHRAASDAVNREWGIK